MRTIGVLSDTHGLLRPEAPAALAGCDLILHAGDVGDLEILAQLGAIAPVHAVYGNTDHGQLRAGLPLTTVVDLGAADGAVGDGGPVGPLAYLLHIAEDLDLDPAAAGIQLVVTGHTHRPEIRQAGGVTYLNPGAAGHRRFSLPVTVARVVVEDGVLTPEIVEIL